MAKISKTSPAVKAAIQRKSAYSLPNNPTDSGLKASDIRNAFYKPIIDAENSAMAEIDRIVDEINNVLGVVTKDVDTIASVSGLSYHGSGGLIYSFNGSEFTVSGNDELKDEVSIPSSVFYQDRYYPVVAIAANAFNGSKITKAEIASTVKSIGENAFHISTLVSVRFFGSTDIGTNAFYEGAIDFSVPREYMPVYESSLAKYKNTLVSFDTIKSNAGSIIALNDYIKDNLANVIKSKVSGEQISLANISTTQPDLIGTVKGVESLSSVKVKKNGKNLFDYNNQTWTNGSILESSGSTSSNTDYKTTDYIQLLKPGKTYVISFYQSYFIMLGSGNATVNQVCYYDENYAFINGAGVAPTSMGRHSYQTTVPTNAKYAKYCCRITDTEIQIELGSVATSYEQYITPTEYTVNTDGTFNAGKPILPVTTLMTDTDSAVIDISYAVDTQSYIDEIGKNKVDKITKDKSVYRTNSSSDTDYSTFSTGVVPKTFMVRDDSGNTYVSTPAAANHCAPKKYVDAADENKVDKMTGQAMVYRTNPESNLDTEYINYTASSSPKTFMVRDANGRTSVASPTASTHAANKEYVDKNKTHIQYGSLDVSKLKSAAWISSASQKKCIISIGCQGMSVDVLKIDFTSQTVSFALAGNWYSASFSDCYYDENMTPLTYEYLQNYLHYDEDMAKTIFLVEYK